MGCCSSTPSAELPSDWPNTLNNGNQGGNRGVGPPSVPGTASRPWSNNTVGPPTIPGTTGGYVSPAPTPAPKPAPYPEPATTNRIEYQPALQTPPPPAPSPAPAPQPVHRQYQAPGAVDRTDDDDEQPHKPNRANTLIVSVEVPEAEEGMEFEDVYDIGEHIGEGAFSKVHLALHRQANQQFAVKIIDRSKMEWGGRDALKDEIGNLKMLKAGPCILQFQDVFYKEKLCYLVTELIPGGELFACIINKGVFSEFEARDAAKCVLGALGYMHDRRIAHRDLKPENLLLMDKGNVTPVKLSDFGFAKSVEDRNSCRTLCGTPGYLAPEILERWPAYDVTCDIWSFGVILFLLLGGYLPFDPSAENDTNTVFERTRNGDYQFYPQRWANISTHAKDLVARCLNINPNKRMTAEAAIDHRWMRADDVVLSQVSIDTSSLKSVVQEGKKREKRKKKKNVMDDLNDDFTVFMDQRQANSIVSHMTGAHKTIATAMTNFKEEGSSGRSFYEFYKKGEQLGKGAFATVHRCTHNRTGFIYAVKEIDLFGLNERELQTLQDEIKVLKYVRGGPSIIRLFDVFRESQKTYLILEEMKGGDLLGLILEKEVFTEREAREICKHFFEAVRYCHRKRIAHRDIKLDNVLLVEKDEGTLKLADFGFSKRCGRKTGLTTMCGTPNYMAPEVFNLPDNGYDFRCDMWSVGVLVYSLLGGYLPFEGDIKEIAKKVTKGKYKFHDKYWAAVSTAAKEMVARMLQVNPDNRLSADEALSCQWMGIDEETLTLTDLSTARQNLKQSNKLKALTKGIIEINRMKVGAAADIPAQIKEEDEEFDKNYELLQQIGHGEFADVYIAINRHTNNVAAVKKVCRRQLVDSDVAALDDEIAVMRLISASDYVIRLQDVYEDADYTHMVMERVNGIVLIDELVKKKKYSEGDAKEVVSNLLRGVSYCHSKRVAIRNLKLENLLLPDHGKNQVRITDFECAKLVTFPNSLHTQCGTQEYVAPEVLENRPSYDVSCDMWTVGVIVFIMVGGYYPFRGDTEMEVLRKVRYGEFKFHSKYWKNISDEAKNLVKQMMTVLPDERISASNALNSPWIRSDSEHLSANLGGNMHDLMSQFKEMSSSRRFQQETHLAMAMSKMEQPGLSG